MDYLLLETGDKLILEDGTGNLLLEDVLVGSAMLFHPGMEGQMSKRMDGGLSA